MIYDVLASYRQIVADTAKQFCIDPSLIYGFIWEESKGDQWAARREPGCTLSYMPTAFSKKCMITFTTELLFQQTSWGLMQVMGYNARSLGFIEQIPRLCLAENGVYFGVKYLNQLAGKYQNVSDIVCAYNHGHAEKDQTGRYVNQPYVDRVLSYQKIASQEISEAANP